MVGHEYIREDGDNDAEKKALALEEKDIQIACTSVNSTQESLTEVRTKRPRQRARTWGNDSVQEEGKFSTWDWQSKARWKARWTWSFHDACLSTWHATKWTARTIKNAPLWKHIRWSKKQFYAFLLLFIWVIIPMTALGMYTQIGLIFADKTMGCGDSFGGQPQNATVTGIEKLFALDATWGRFSFSQAKTIDILWDLLIGKGAQALAWWATYNVFCDALLRAIERHPASFSIFQRMAMEGPGLHSLWTLTKELWRAKSLRTRALFFYMFWSTGYVLLVPIVLGAMTGYDSTSIAWIDLEGSNNIVPASELKMAWVIKGTKNETWNQLGCQDYDLWSDYRRTISGRRDSCDCRYPNGTILTPQQQNYLYYHTGMDNYDTQTANCAWGYPNNTQTWSDGYSSPTPTHPCNSTFDVLVNGKTYNADDLVTDFGYCYNSIGYNYTYLEGKSRCLPDTANPSYQWGFATLMSGLFVFVTSAWVASMYVLWQDAQFNSELVKAGYRLTPLRAAFAMAVAARRRTGLSGKALVSEKTRVLGRQLYGRKGGRGTVLDHGLFLGDAEDMEDVDADGDGATVKSPISPSSPLSIPSPCFAEAARERNWAVSPTEAENMEGRALVRSDTDLSVHVLSDEELRTRYLRGVEEARVGVGRKPLSRQATLVEEGIWERDRGRERCANSGVDDKEDKSNADGKDSRRRDEDGHNPGSRKTLTKSKKPG